MKAAIQFENVAKVFRIGTRSAGEYATLRETLMRAATAPWHRLRQLTRSAPSAGDAEPNLHWALRDVSFDVQPGEVIGIIGRNGAGKSTLLKVLSQITEPSSGRIVVRGRVGSLLEVGTGFHQELTGRENIFLNGAILGMARAEIRRKFDDIVAFADIGAFLDTPVKHYSSGMYVRLAFAVASHLEPEILVVDEVLAVGDAAFQKKCLGKMDQVSRSGRTVLFVSHSMAAIQNLCERVAVLDRGRLAYLGDCESGIKHYMESCDEPAGGEIDLAGHARRRPGCTTLFHRLRLLDASGRPTDRLPCGDSFAVELEVDPISDISQLQIGIICEDAFGGKLFTVGTYLTGTPLSSGEGRQTVTCRVADLPLAPGRYALSLIAGPMGQVDVDVIDQAVWFEATCADYYGNGRPPNAMRGPFLMRSQWESVPY